MSFEALRSKHADFYTPRFEVIVDGDRITESTGVVSDLTVETALDVAGRFSFTLNHPFNREKGAFSGLNWDRVKRGREVEISMGYAAPLIPMFVGKITSIDTAFPSGGQPTIDVSGQGLMDDMMRGTKSRSWDGETDSAVAQQIATEYFSPQNVTVERTNLKRPKIVQERTSDYHFLESLAKRNKFELSVRRTSLYVGPPRKRSPVATVRYGESLTSFSTDLNSSGRVNEVEVRHYDPTTKESIVGRARTDGTGRGKKVIKRPVRSVEEANQVAEAELNEILQNRVRANGQTIGLPEIWAGETVRVEGVDRFSDTYWVNSATHRIGSSGYTTSFALAPLEDVT